MTTTLDPLSIRLLLGRKLWSPPEPFGPDGWLFRSEALLRSVLVTVADHEDGAEWVHASIAGREETPAYDELARLHRAVYKDGYAYQVFVPRSEHVNIHPHALHLWGRLDGRPVLPRFAEGGSI